MLVTACLLICVQLIQGKSVEQYRNDTRPQCRCGSGNTVNTRVVGGYTVAKYKFPFASALLFHPEDGVIPFCGGTLITDRHVLTAAHCVKEKNTDDLAVDVGDYSLASQKDGIIIDARSITLYPEYHAKSFHTDIAIVELERPVPFGIGLRTAILSNPDLELKPGTTVSVYGWGRLDYERADHPDKLNAVELPVIDNKKCQKKFISKIEPNMICAGGEEGKDACIGDSGSGLLVRLDNEYVLTGVVSFGRHCALPNIPGVYSRVSSYVDWILYHTQTAGCKPCIYGENE